MGLRVLSTRASLPGGGLARLASKVDLVTDLATGVDGVVCLGNDRVDATFLDAAGPGLQVVSLASAGFDAVDQDAAAARGVVVTHTPDVLAETTADLAFALILMARRRLGSARDTLYAGEWTTFRMGDFLGLDVHGATLGLIGYGQIARAVERRAAGFGMRVLHHSRSSAGSVDLPTLLAQSDVVSLHVPLTPATSHLIGAAELRAMKPTATLVNTARGAIVDEAAVLAALRDGTIHSAGLDVFAHEPRGADVADLVAQSRLVALPHIGSATERTRAAMVDLAVDNVLDVLAGLPARTPLPGTAAMPR